MKKQLLGAALCAATIVGFGGSAFAGEYTGNGTVKIPKGRSECAYSGLDQPDLNGPPEGEDHYGMPGDDGLWGLTPAKGRVQNAGQIIATFGPGAANPARDGCNPNNPGEEH